MENISSKENPYILSLLTLFERNKNVIIVEHTLVEHMWPTPSQLGTYSGKNFNRVINKIYSTIFN